MLLLTSLLLGWFGIGDLGGALTYTGRITGAILVLAAVTTLLGAAAVVDHRFRNSFPYSGLVVLIGTAAALLANGMVLLETFKDGDCTAYRTLWGLLTAGSLWAFWVVLRTGVVIPAPKRVAAAVIVSLALGIANFGYDRLYQPYQHGAKPVVTINVQKPVLRKDRKAFAVPVDLRLENHSDVGFYVLGTEFHAMGERVALSRKDRLREQWRTDAEQQPEFQETHPLSRREIHQPGQLVTAHPWMPVGSWIEASDAFVTRMIVQLPIDTPYDRLAFYATASFARKDRLDVERMGLNGYTWQGGKAPRWMPKEVDSVVYRARVHENNMLDEHTRDPRYVTVYWQFGAHGAGLVETITRNGEEDREITGKEARELVSRYGLRRVETGAVERTLWDVKAQR
ncbi:hypothetical protein ABZ920_19620 [Streptomyces sp. NPDC046831]|uniref:hypothetical protein n=1 Tax=Streptomyces sp. NPDC046831 TaxID=3154805 RepID=UPI0033D950F5